MNEFRARADEALAGVVWTPAHSARVARRAKRARRRARAWVLAAALLLCAATALAAAQLARSESAAAIREARRALTEAYGLSAESIAFFTPVYARTENGWEVRFLSGLSARTGEYAVLREGGAVRARWSYDGARMPGIWREAELRAYLERVGAVPAGDAPPPVYTVGESADNVVMRGVTYCEPLPGDIAETTAINLAVSALREDLGAGAAVVGTYTEFVQNERAERMWCVSMNVSSGGVSVYACAYVNAVSGEIVKAHYESGGYG